MSDAIFVPQGDGYMATEHAVGPWNPAHLHGGAAAALMMAAVEEAEPDSPMTVVRATMEFTRPVPRDLLHVSATIERPGRKVQLVAAAVSAAGVEVARARVLRVRQTELELPATVGEMHDDDAPSPPADEAGSDVGVGGFGRAMSIVFQRGAFLEPGPARVWFRLRHPVIEGRPTSGLQRVVAAADFGNGVSAVLDWSRYLFINPDLTVYLHRPPVGEWICLDAGTALSGLGVGVAQSALWDSEGALGRSLQGLLVDERA
ncbi:MAG: hypothetical protein QOE92_1606 [Chloroflexota bacterium]|nr:hypothetical protein [Chloroflexota bacterium]